MAKFRWTRNTYKQAQHLSRLLSRLNGYGRPPLLVERYIKLHDDHYQGRDPLTLPIAYRYDRDDIPF